jgi:hypothetical protein
MSWGASTVRLTCSCTACQPSSTPSEATRSSSSSARAALSPDNGSFQEGPSNATSSPEDEARRELIEESGLDIIGELELVGAYPWVYGGDCLQLSYRGQVTDGDPVVSHEHHGARWIDPVELRAGLTDDMINALADGNTPVGDVVRHIRTDLDRYLRRIGRYPT